MERWRLAVHVHVMGWALAAALAAVLGGSATFVIERLRIDAIALRWAAVWTLWSGHVLLATMAVALGVAAIGAARMVWPAAANRPLRAAVAAGAIAVAPILPALREAGRRVEAGPWVSEQWFAPLVAAAPTLAALVAAPAILYCACHRADPGSVGRGGMPGAMVGALLGALVGLSLLDHHVAPGLYPELHMVMHGAMTSVAVTLAWRCVRGLGDVADTRRGRVVLTIALLACGGACIGWLQMSHQTRAGLVLRAPATGEWIRAVFPRQPWSSLHYVLGELDVHAGGLPATPAARGTDAFARDPTLNVVFVVADALRADALPPSRPPGGTEFAKPGDTPRLDAWIAGAYRFRHAYTAATVTRRAMPTIFRSIEAADDPFIDGQPLGPRLAGLGHTPLAVVHRYFRPAKYPQVAAVLEGFAGVEVYDNGRTDRAVPLALSLLEAPRERPFALFLHLFTVHSPGFDGKPLRSKGRVKNYRRSLVYLDTQMGELLDGLERLGLRENTVVVLLSDHGEGLGDHGVLLHGPKTFEEDVRVPFAIEIPGHAGRVVDETVGTIDVVPTLTDILGAPPRAGDRGRSLVPLMTWGEDEPRRPYYFENEQGSTVGVVIGRDKLIYEKGVEVAHRFDVAMDPDERLDLHGEDVRSDRALMEALVQFQRRSLRDALEDPATLALLRAHLQAVDPAAPGAAFELLVRLVALRPEPDLVRRCGEIFDATGDPAVRIIVLGHLLERSPQTMELRADSWLRNLVGSAAEADVVEALAGHTDRPFAETFIAARLLTVANAAEPHAWGPWLSLVAGWSKPASMYAEPLARMLERAYADEGVTGLLLARILHNAAELEGESPYTPTVISAANSLAAHRSAHVRAAAAAVLARGERRGGVAR